MKMKMASFKEFISEDEHKDGTYVNVKLNELDKDKLYDWVLSHDISNPLDKDEYHVTVIYSRAPCPEAENYNYELPITGHITGWKIFDAPIGRCLVAHVDSSKLQTINTELKRDYGATSDFPDYIPHITVSYDYKGELPTEFPDMLVTFDKVQVKGLDPTWRPKKGNDNGND